MFNAIDLQELAERQGPERAFVSMYLSSPDALPRVEGRIGRGAGHQGRAATGPEHVLGAAAVGRVQRLLVTRDAKVKGWRCRGCENIATGPISACGLCESEDVFAVDLVEELVQLVTRHQGSVEFSDHIRGLTKAGHVAALLRY